MAYRLNGSWTSGEGYEAHMARQDDPPSWGALLVIGHAYGPGSLQAWVEGLDYTEAESLRVRFCHVWASWRACQRAGA